MNKHVHILQLYSSVVEQLQAALRQVIPYSEALLYFSLLANYFVLLAFSFLFTLAIQPAI